MKGQLLFLAVFSLSIAIVGCNTTDKTLKTSNDLSVIEYDATKRAIYVLKRDSSGKDPNLLVVTEPFPDVATSYTALLSASLTGFQKVGDVNATLYLSSQITDLAHRGQSLQILREALYRLNELYANGAINKNQVAILYQQTIGAVQATAIAELGGRRDVNEATKQAAIKAIQSHDDYVIKMSGLLREPNSN